MKYATALFFLTQQRMTCTICFGEGKRTTTHPECLLGGSAVLGRKTDRRAYERLHGQGSYYRAVARNVARHVRACHADHPLARRYAAELGLSGKGGAAA